MTRNIELTQKIALLATGDEICNGDILNSNTKEIAHRLFTLGMNVGMHMAVSDNTTEIKTAISFLLKTHDALIITGGLGPTSDDLTRFALAEATQHPLVFNEATWEAIVARLKKFGYNKPPESNRQQALFPETATIIPNPNGTAAGCILNTNNKIIFMLPGPPLECLPMVDQTVIPLLKEKHFAKNFFYRSWLLFSVSEGQIAEELDALAKPFECTTGYRLAFPYLEFKIYSNNEKDFYALSALVEQHVHPYLISVGTETASEMLIKSLLQSSRIQIDDQATGGLLESIITTPTTSKQLYFSNQKNFEADLPAFIITGLKDYWEQSTDRTITDIEITFYFNHHKETFKNTLPFRGERVKRHAVEWICYQIRKKLS